MPQLKIMVATAGSLFGGPIPALLAAMAEGGYGPTLFGTSEGRMVPFNPGDLGDLVASEGRYATVLLARKAPPRWDGYLAELPLSLSAVGLETRVRLSSKACEEFFRLGSRLAEAIKADFGFVHLVRESGVSVTDAYLASGNLSPEQFQKNGPRAVCARTWLGSHVLDLLGASGRAKLPASSHMTSWGALEIDLVPKPWSATTGELAARQRDVHEALAPSQIQGDYSDFPDYTPGARWRPIPLRKNS